jgi:AcrR family transcriptional regulator
MRKGERTKEAIVEEAVALASAGGLEGLSIGALADKTGLSKSGLFAHFGSKEALQIAVLEAAAADFVARVVTPARAETDGVRRIIALMENWVAWSNDPARRGCPFVAAQVEWDDREGPVRDHLVALQRTWLDYLSRAAERAKEQGRFRPDLDTYAFAHDLYAIALGYHNAHRLMRDPKAETFARAAFTRLIRDARGR